MRVELFVVRCFARCPCVRCCLVESGVVMAELNFNLNDKFSSLEELKLKLENYKRHNNVDLHIRDSRTLQQAMKEKKLSEDRVKNMGLKYYHVKYTCVFGGRDNFKARGEGARKNKYFSTWLSIFRLVTTIG